MSWRKKLVLSLILEIYLIYICNAWLLNTFISVCELFSFRIAVLCRLEVAGSRCTLVLTNMLLSFKLRVEPLSKPYKTVGNLKSLFVLKTWLSSY